MTLRVEGVSGVCEMEEVEVFLVVVPFLGLAVLLEEEASFLVVVLDEVDFFFLVTDWGVDASISGCEGSVGAEVDASAGAGSPLTAVDEDASTLGNAEAAASPSSSILTAPGSALL